LCLFDDHPVLQESIGWATTCDILTAEIAAIAATLEYIQELFEPEPQELPLFATKLQVSIFSDSRLALEAIKEGNGAKKGRSFLRKIAESFFTLQKKDIEVEFRWIPGHSGICGNELTAPLARRVREAAKLMKAIEQDRKCESDQFDPDGLPGQYT
jgi:ribonuclease HI